MSTCAITGFGGFGGGVFDRRGVAGSVANEFDHGEQSAGIESRNPGEEMAMIEYFHAHAVREHFRKMTRLDRQLTRWRWFQRNEHRPRRSEWRIRVGQGLIRLGCWLQGHGGTQPARTSGEF